MIRVEAPSRLHFGLMALPGKSMWPDSEGQLSIPARVFGGVGLMVERPGIALTVEPAPEWTSIGPCGERAISVARTVCEKLRIDHCYRINVEHCPPEHFGLGTGTQLSLAVARAIVMATGHGPTPVHELAGMVNRGRRSALGIHGFDCGGFLVEGGKREANAISPLVARLAFPESWSLILIVTRGMQGHHGRQEMAAFEHLARVQPRLESTEAVCRLVLLGMLPAIIDQDLDGFGAALYDFNRRAGEMFLPSQGGVYAHPRIANLVELLRSAGIKGVGHSSWGPTVFAIVERTVAADLSNWLVRQGISREEIVITQACNIGATSQATC